MSKLRSINTIIWSDTWFELLSPSAKLLFIYFVTNEKTNMLGVYEISIRKVSFETGIKQSDIEKYLKEFEKEGKIKYSQNRVLLLNFVKHQNYNFNMMKSAIRIYNNLPKELNILKSDVLEETKEGFKTLCKGFGGVRKIEYEYEVEDEIEYKEEKETSPLFYLKNLDKDLIFKNWLDYRKSIKKPIKVKTTLDALIKRFEKENLETIKFIVNLSIENGWVGLFWDKQQNLKEKNFAPKKENDMKGVDSAYIVQKKYGLVD